MYSLLLEAFVLAIVSVCTISMIDEAYSRVYGTDSRYTAAKQCVCFHNTTEGVLSRKVVVQWQGLTLFFFGEAL